MQSFTFKTLSGRVVLPDAYEYDPVAIFSGDDGDVLVRRGGPNVSLQRLTPPHTVTELFSDVAFHPLFVYDDRVLVSMRRDASAATTCCFVTLRDVRTGKPLTPGGAPVALEGADGEFITAVPQPDPGLAVLRTGRLRSAVQTAVAGPGPIQEDDDNDQNGGADRDPGIEWRDHVIDISGDGGDGVDDGAFSEPSATRIFGARNNAKCAFSPSGRVLVDVEQPRMQRVKLTVYDAFISRRGCASVRTVTVPLQCSEVVGVSFLTDGIVLIATEAEAVAVHLVLAKVVANFRMLAPGESGEDTVYDFVTNQRWIAFTVSDGFMNSIAVAPTASLLGNLLPPQR